MTYRSMPWLLSLVVSAGLGLGATEARALGLCSYQQPGYICHHADHYRGCYQDGTTRRLPYVLTSNNTFVYYGTAASVSPWTCLAAAQAAGYPFAAMQTGSQCWAGYDAPVQSDLLPDTSCNTPCALGASGQYCGAAWINSVYATGGCDYSISCTGFPATACNTDVPLPAGATCSTPGAQQYLGCFVDSSTRWGIQLTTLSAYNISQCLSEGQSRGYSYAGLQWYNQCWVSNTTPGSGSYSKAVETDCSTPCNATGANPGQFCGGNMRNSVYALGAGPLCTSALACDGASVACDPAANAALNPAPGAPSGVTAVPNNGQVTLGWSAVLNASSYTIWYGTVSQGYTNIVDPVFGTSSTKTSLVNGQTYYFAVTARDSCGTSPLSKEIYAMPLASWIPISSCQQVNGPGSYSLIQSIGPGLSGHGLPGQPDGCLYIHDTSGVTVSANGFSITGNSSGTSVYASNMNGLVLENGTFPLGVKVNLSSHVTIQDSTVQGAISDVYAVSFQDESGGGSYNTVTRSIIDGYPFGDHNQSLDDDPVMIINDRFDTISNNVIQNGYDTGVESEGYLTDSIIVNNDFSGFVNAAIGGWYSSEVSRNIVSNNTYSSANGSRLLWYFYSDDCNQTSCGALCIGTNCLPDGTGYTYFFRNNYFSDNTYSGGSDSQFYSAIYNPIYAPDGGFPSGVTLDMSNNYFCANAFGPAPQMTGSALPHGTSNANGPFVIDGQANTCTANSNSQQQDYPITCSWSAGPAVGNASFEAPALAAASFDYRPTGGTWTFTGDSGIARNGSAFNNPTAPVGVQVAFVQDQGVISQSVPFSSGEAYTLVASLAQRSSTATQSIQVEVDGNPVGQPIVPPSNMAYVAFAQSLGTLSGSHTVALVGKATIDATVFVDNVRIVQQP